MTIHGAQAVDKAPGRLHGMMAKTHSKGLADLAALEGEAARLHREAEADRQSHLCLVQTNLVRSH